jgi:hypothetical protein
LVSSIGLGADRSILGAGHCDLCVLYAVQPAQLTAIPESGRPAAALMRINGSKRADRLADVWGALGGY